jgi:hypothetical protein
MESSICHETPLPALFTMPLEEIDCTCDAFVEAWLEQSKKADVLMQQQILEENKKLEDFIDHFNEKDEVEAQTFQPYTAASSQDEDDDVDVYDQPELSNTVIELDAAAVDPAHLNFVYNRLAALAARSAYEDKTERETRITKNMPSWLIEHNTKKNMRTKEEAKKKSL